MIFEPIKYWSCDFLVFYFQVAKYHKIASSKRKLEYALAMFLL